MPPYAKPRRDTPYMAVMPNIYDEAPSLIHRLASKLSTKVRAKLHHPDPAYSTEVFSLRAPHEDAPPTHKLRALTNTLSFRLPALPPWANNYRQRQHRRHDALASQKKSRKAVFSRTISLPRETDAQRARNRSLAAKRRRSMNVSEAQRRAADGRLAWPPHLQDEMGVGQGRQQCRRQQNAEDGECVSPRTSVALLAPAGRAGCRDGDEEEEEKEMRRHSDGSWKVESLDDEEDDDVVNDHDEARTGWRAEWWGTGWETEGPPPSPMGRWNGPSGQVALPPVEKGFYRR